MSNIYPEEINRIFCKKCNSSSFKVENLVYGDMSRTIRYNLICESCKSNYILHPLHLVEGLTLKEKLDDGLEGEKQ